MLSGLKVCEIALILDGKRFVMDCGDLSLIKTGQKYTPETLGFAKSMSATAKTMPIRLLLKPEHVASVRSTVYFTSLREEIPEIVQDISLSI